MLWLGYNAFVERRTPICNKQERSSPTAVDNHVFSAHANRCISRPSVWESESRPGYCWQRGISIGVLPCVAEVLFLGFCKPHPADYPVRIPRELHAGGRELSVFRSKLIDQCLQHKFDANISDHIVSGFVSRQHCLRTRENSPSFIGSLVRYM